MLRPCIHILVPRRRHKAGATRAALRYGSARSCPGDARVTHFLPPPPFASNVTTAAAFAFRRASISTCPRAYLRRAGTSERAKKSPVVCGVLATSSPCFFLRIPFSRIFSSIPNSLRPAQQSLIESLSSNRREVEPSRRCTLRLTPRLRRRSCGARLAQRLRDKMAEGVEYDHLLKVRRRYLGFDGAPATVAKAGSCEYCDGVGGAVRRLPPHGHSQKHGVAALRPRAAGHLLRASQAAAMSAGDVAH
jgi:hypothetical protein